MVGHPGGWQRWIKDISDVANDTEGPLSEGDSLTYKYRGGLVTTQVVQYQQERVLGIHSSEKTYEFHESIWLEDHPQGTKVTFIMGFEPTVWWASILAVFLAPGEGSGLGQAAPKDAGRAEADAGDGRPAQVVRDSGNCAGPNLANEWSTCSWYRSTLPHLHHEHK